VDLLERRGQSVDAAVSSEFTGSNNPFGFLDQSVHSTNSSAQVGNACPSGEHILRSEDDVYQTLEQCANLGRVFVSLEQYVSK
jgi:hypothetical protein